MGRAPCCDKANVKRGPWCPEEDQKLKSFIEKHGTGGNWIALPHKAGLKRCGKSCRLRWLNYLRPNIKHGEFSDAEDRTICNLYAAIGSRWSIIAQNLQGRTDNDIKNYWNTKLKKKLLGASSSQRKQTINHHHFHQQQIFQQEQHQQFQQFQPQLFPSFQATSTFAPASSSSSSSPLPFQIPSNSFLPNQIPAEAFSISHMDLLNSVSSNNATATTTTTTTTTLFQDTRAHHQQHQYPMKHAHAFGGEADCTQKIDFECNEVAAEGNDIWKTMGFESLLSNNGLDEDKKYLLTDLESSDVPLLETGGSLSHESDNNNNTNNTNNIGIPSTWSVEESPLASYSDFEEIKRLITSTSSSIHGCNNIFQDEDPQSISIPKPKEEEGGGGGGGVGGGRRSQETPMYNYY